MREIAQVIKELLRSFTDNAVPHGKLGHRYNTYWTEEIIYALSNEGKERGFEVHSRINTCEDWVPDLCWLDIANGTIRSIPLIVMCEWRSSPHIEQRFYTLVGARPHLRVAILDATFPKSPAGHAKLWAQQKVSDLKSLASAFDNSQPTDTYLFCIWCRDEDTNEWYFEFGPSVQSE